MGWAGRESGAGGAGQVEQAHKGAPPQPCVFTSSKVGTTSGQGRREPLGTPKAHGEAPVGERQLCPETFPCPAWGREQGTHRATFLWVPEVQFKAA